MVICIYYTWNNLLLLTSKGNWVERKMADIDHSNRKTLCIESINAYLFPLRDGFCMLWYTCFLHLLVHISVLIMSLFMFCLFVYFLHYSLPSLGFVGDSVLLYLLSVCLLPQYLSLHIYVLFMSLFMFCLFVYFLRYSLLYLSPVGDSVLRHLFSVCLHYFYISGHISFLSVFLFYHIFCLLFISFFFSIFRADVIRQFSDFSRETFFAI